MRSWSAWKVMFSVVGVASVFAVGVLVSGLVSGVPRAGNTESEEPGGSHQISRNNSAVVGSSFVGPLVELYGDIYIGEGSFIAGSTVLRAAPELRLDIGSDTNAQDSVIARSLQSNSTIGDRVSLAHHALVRDSRVGDFTFIGFQAEIVNATISDGALVSAGSYVEGVTIPEDALLAPGTVVTDQATADALPTLQTADVEFKEAVLDVNAEFAEGYIDLYESEGYEAVVDVGPNPQTDFNPQSISPRTGDGAEIGEFARVVGDVVLGENAEVNDRASLRADEGSPIVIGDNANIEERVTFHALENTDIEVGDDLDVGDDAVLHGPLRVGDRLTVGDNSVVFRVEVGDDVIIGEDVVIQGPVSSEDPNQLTLSIPDGAVIPDNAVITDEDSLRAAIAEAPQTIPETGGMNPHPSH